MIATLALVFTLIVAALHIVFMVVETFLWTTPGVRKSFRQSAEDAEKSKVLAGNQGVYNGVLGALLAWAAITGEPHTTLALLVFVILVGLYGAATAKGSILFVQALPAALALALNWMA